MFAQVSAGAGDAGGSAPAAKIFTIFEGISEIQRMLIGRAVTGLDVR
jgi:alkylation response protein AidB-like acyl-CoA dehydrogenase